jgi:galactose mutarotase-like enzyme
MPGVRREPDPEVPSLERVTLVSGTGVEAAIVPRAGMVVTSLTQDGTEVLARRKGLAHYLATGSTYGIPLLAPWANRLAATRQVVDGVSFDVVPGQPHVHTDDAGLAMHGLLAGSPAWVVRDARADADSAWLRAVMHVDERLESFASFPFPHDLDVEMVLRGDVLRVATTLTATSPRPVPVAFGWHPWFAFPDVPRAAWEVHGPLTRQAVLTAAHLPTGEVLDVEPLGGVLGDRYLDDLFLDVAEGSVVSVRAGARSVAVRYTSGYDVAVVFAPTDLAVACVEPMTAPTDPFAGRWPLRRVVSESPFEAVFEVALGRH